MFRFALGCLVLAVLGLFLRSHSHGLVFDWWAFALLSPWVVLVGASLGHWATHPHGIRDTWAGGSISMKRTHPQRLEWSDWTLWLTRQGHIDRLTHLIRVEKRLLMGLIPLGKTVKSTREFHMVQLDEQVHFRPRNRRHYEMDQTEVPTHSTLTLVLSNSAGERLVLLDLNASDGPSHERDFMHDLEGQVQKALAAG